MTRRQTPQEANATAVLIEAQDERARRAYDLRKRGRSWWAVAEELALSEHAAKALVANAISSAAELVSQHTRHQLLAMEVARLDDLMDAHWDNALLDPRSAELVLKVIAQRSRLLGLEELPAAVATQQTVVIAGTSEEYVAALRLVVGNTERVRELPAANGSGEAG